jgi:PH (Pleckstrin Homology) domain-containing protein
VILPAAARPVGCAAGTIAQVSDEQGTAVAATDGPDEEQGHTAPGPAVFRAVPTVSLVAVVFLALCLSPIAFQGGPWFLLFLIPLAGAAWVVRTRTRVDTAGLQVRRLLGTRSMAWSEVATLRLVERGWVRAVPQEGAELELRGVRIRDLGRVGEASGGRVSAPSPAEAEAAAEHARELAAARMRVARLRERQESADGAAPVADTEDATAADPEPAAADEGPGSITPSTGT